jgi:hypothetical protein
MKRPKKHPPKRVHPLRAQREVLLALLGTLVRDSDAMFDAKP